MKTRITTILCAILLILPMSVSAARIKGKLKTTAPSDYKVLAINKNGSSTVAEVASNGKFSIRVKKGTTLHLVKTSGRYFGPIVTVKKRKALTVTSGQKGSIGSVIAKNGFATASYKKAKDLFSSKPKVAFDKTTGPSGAGKFGLVLSPVAEVSQSSFKSQATTNKIGSDLDKDGIPDLLDIDDDGDLKLDTIDPVDHSQTDFNGEVASTLRLELSNSLNVNIGSISDEEVDALVRDNLFLLMLLQNNTSNETVSSVNIDCGSLSYCSDPGTATIQMDDPPISNASLWSEYDPEGDGLPNLYIRSGHLPEINVKPHATRSQIGTGDTIFFKVTTDKGEHVLPAMLPFVFATTPAIKSYTDSNTTTNISYPVASTGPGTSTNPIALTSQQIGLTFWRPQRNAIEGAESAGYVDMGGLNYGVYLSVQGSSSVFTCETSEYSSLSETLQARSSANGAQVLEDTAADSAASSSNLLAFTLDIGTCLTRQGITTTGKTVMIDLVATSDAQDQTSQSIHFQLP